MAGKILIVNDIAINRMILNAKLVAACYETVQANDSAAALQLSRRHFPDLIIVEALPAKTDSAELCAALRAEPATARVPIIVIGANDSLHRIRLLNAGADEIIDRPFDNATILAHVRSLLRSLETTEELRQRGASCQAMGLAEPEAVFSRPARVALIAAKPQTALAWRRALAPFMSDDLVVIDRVNALNETHAEAGADLYLVAADLNQRGDGLQLLSELRSRAGSRNAAICIVLPPEAHDLAAMALDLGANALVPDRFDGQELALRLQIQLRQKREADQLRASVRNGLRLAAVDPLTGLHNRRYALPRLAQIESRAQTNGRAFAVMVIDLDRFKHVNDTWGHAAGDAVLATIAHRMRMIVRPNDLLARIGGEEFLIAMPDTGLADAQRTAERLRRLAEATPVPLPQGDMVQVTLSIGLAVGGGCPEPASAEGLMAKADRALMAAKMEGRNQVTISMAA